jgi:Bacterial-like globin
MSIDEQEDSAQLTPYQAAGELVGITRLVDEFYANMDSLPEAKVIRDMHPPDLAESRKKLTYFLINGSQSATRNVMPGSSVCGEPLPSNHTVTN